MHYRIFEKPGNMGIRTAQPADTPAIQTLLAQLGYVDTTPFLEKKLASLSNDPAEVLLVYEQDSDVVAFLSLHFIPQIALPGDFARISYFAVKDSARNLGIGRQLEEHITALARERNCDRIEVHCHSRRSDAHRFYTRQGFEESPKYLIKSLKQ
jgi:GNAT superfamily N-acetyltransferase